LKRYLRHRVRISSVIRTVLLCLLVTAAAVRAQTESSDLDFARKLYDDGLYLLAADQYEDFIRSYPEHPLVSRARFMVAESHLYQGDIETAEEGYGEFLRQHPDDSLVPEAWFRLGGCLLQMGRHQEAVAAYEKSLQISPQGERAPEALFGLARALREDGQLVEALEKLEVFNRQYPQDPNIHSVQLARGEILVELGRLNQAAIAFQSAGRTAQTAAERSRAGYRQSRVLITSERDSAAIVVLERVVRADSISIHADSALILLGDLYMAAGLHRPAARAFGRLHERGRDPELAEQGGLKQAQALERSGQPDKAMAVYRQWLEEHPDSPMRALAELGMADLLERTGDADAAATLLEDLIRRTGDEPWGIDAWLKLADLQRRRGHSERVLTTYRRFLNRYPGASQSDSIAFLMARIQEQDLGRPLAALRTYRDLSTEHPGSRWAERAAFAVGRLLEDAQEYEQARETYQIFSQEHPYSSLYPRAQERIEYLSAFRIPEEPLALEAMVDIQDQLASGILTEEEVDLRLADIYLRHLRNFDRAAATLQRFLDRHAGSLLTDQALHQLGRCHDMKAEMLLADGDSSGAEREKEIALRSCRRLLRDYPSSQWADECALRVIADIVEETDTDSLMVWKDRRELYETFLRTHPASEWRPLALLQVAEALWKSGAGDSLMLSRADSVLVLITDHHRRSAWADSAAWHRVTIAHQLGDDQRALASSQDFLWDFPESPLRSRVFFLQAEIHEQNGDDLQAARLYRSVAEDFAYHDLTEEAWLREARSFWTAGDPGEAQQVLEGFTRRYPDSERWPAAVLLMARYAAAQGQGDRARSLVAGVEKVSGGDRPDPAKQLAIGDVYRQLGDYDKALARYRTVIESHGSRPEAQEAVERMAETSFEAGQYAQAGDDYQQALAGSPDEDSRVILSAGYVICLYRQGLFEEAVRARREFQKAYQDETERVAGLLLEEAEARLRNEEQEQAEKTLRTIITEYPQTLTAQEAEYRLGIISLSTGRYQEALERFTALLDRYPETDLEGLVLFKMGSALYGMEQYPDASVQYRRAADRISDDDLKADALFNAGICRARMNDWEGAISAYRQLLDEFPGHPDGRTWSLRLGFAYLEAGQAGRALETFAGIDPGTDDELGAELQFWIGECYFKMDRYERAAQEYLRVGFLYPQQVQWAATAEYNAGVSYEKLGRVEEARTIYRKLILTRGTGDQWGQMAEERLRQLGE